MKKKAVKDSPNQLKNEKNVRESLSRLQLGEENTTTPIPKPEERKKSSADIIAKPMEFAYPCRVCGVVGHWSNLCPYLECVPDSITKVGKGYKIVNYRRGRRAVAFVCAYCMKVEQHESEGCPNKSIYYEVRGLPVPPHLGAPTA